MTALNVVSSKTVSHITIKIKQTTGLTSSGGPKRKPHKNPLVYSPGAVQRSVENDPPPEAPRPLVHRQFAEIKAQDKHIKRIKHGTPDNRLSIQLKKEEKLKSLIKQTEQIGNTNTSPQLVLLPIVRSPTQSRAATGVGGRGVPVLQYRRRRRRYAARWT